MENCIFCKIITNEIPAQKVYEDECTLAFLDIKPNHPGHTLVIPKEHFANIYVTPAETYARMSLVAQKIAVTLKQSLECDGVNIIMNNDEGAGQVIFHSHIHVIPRYKDDGFVYFPQGEYKQGEAEEVLEKIKSFIK